MGERLKKLKWFILFYATSLILFAAFVYGLKGVFRWVMG
jgi:hypothetical protein